MREAIKNLKIIYKYGKEFKFNLFLEIIGSVFGIIITVIIPIFAANQLVNFTNSFWEQVIYISLIIFAANFIQNLSTVLIRKNTQMFWGGTVKNIQMALGSEILKIEQKTIDDVSSGTFIQRITSDTEKLASIFTVGMGYLVGLTSSIGVFVAVFIINKQIFLYYLGISLILTLFHLIKVKKYGKKYSDFLNQSDKVYGLIGEMIKGIRDIKLLNAKPGIMSSLKENIEVQNTKRIKMRNTEILYNFIVGTLTGLFELILIFLLINLTKNNTISVAIAIVLFTYKAKITGDFMEKLSNLLNEIKSFNISCKRVLAILENNEFKKETFGTKHLKSINGNLSFKNVDFSYNKNQQILNNVSFDIEKGETVGFVGKSGAGKTTIFNLITKMYSINKGEITIENININDLDKDSIRENVTTISQNPYIFNLTIRENLKLVKKDLTNKEMVEACKIARISDYIETLPQKYDTIIGENGINLSGGQKQRLAIARAFIRKTKIILFDEATSALDNETQSKVLQAINNLKNNYTILIIAHRLSTIMNCDKIIILDNGKINGVGTHKELLKNNILYKNLYNSELKENEKTN